MDDSRVNGGSSKDYSSLLPNIGTVINVCGGDEGITRTFQGMLNQKLLWKEREYSPIGVPQRLLPSPLFSDAEGLGIMRVISKLPTYYITNGEVELFEERGQEIANLVPQNAILIDLGCG